MEFEPSRRCEDFCPDYSRCVDLVARLQEFEERAHKRGSFAMNGAIECNGPRNGACQAKLTRLPMIDPQPRAERAEFLRTLGHFAPELSG